MVVVEVVVVVVVLVVVEEDKKLQKGRTCVLGLTKKENKYFIKNIFQNKIIK